MPSLKNAYRVLFSGALSVLVSVLLVKAHVMLFFVVLGGIGAAAVALPLFELLVRDRIDWV
ncbi:MAG: hypothetical protein P8X75_00475 [Limibacillus sp.]|jgi:hypothetical protein